MFTEHSSGSIFVAQFSIMSGALEAAREMRVLVLVIYCACSVRQRGKQDRAGEETGEDVLSGEVSPQPYPSSGA